MQINISIVLAPLDFHPASATGCAVAGSGRPADASRSEHTGSTGADGNDGHLPNTLRDGSSDFVVREDSISSSQRVSTFPSSY
jgi:hypothetical protein